ncbi:eIF-2-alpha kinase GCN2-like isoform X2 [Amaranthus tricolor]|nr:eIF-2-alpha kinase GCN2-like isoform X2 [Amaranthus tricolor]
MSLSMYGSDASDTPSASSDALNALKLPKSTSPGSNGSHGSDAHHGYIKSRYKSEFEELAMLGEGVFGKVFRCRNRLDEKEYAIKVIPFSSEEQEKIVLEVKILAKMCHPNVVTYHQAWIEDRLSASPPCSEGSSSSSTPSIDKTLYIILELCFGTLESKESKDIKNNNVWKTINEIYSGLEYIHNQGVIHRDLTLQNIFLDRAGVAKIGDFGIARFCDEDGRANLSENSGHGALKYGAQELTADIPYAVKATDIYALGVVIFQLLYRDGGDSDITEATKNFTKNKILPTSWTRPLLAETLFQMINDNPNFRPYLIDLKSLLHEEHSNKKRKM